MSNLHRINSFGHALFTVQIRKYAETDHGFIAKSRRRDHGVMAFCSGKICYFANPAPNLIQMTAEGNNIMLVEVS